MKTAFVTGGTGFVGLNLVEQLRARGTDVVALHRPASNVARLTRLGVTLVRGSLTSARDVLEAMPENCDAVFHVAGNTSMWSGAREEQTRDNVDGTRNVVEAAIARRAKCLVYTSSVSSFGVQAPPSFDETAESTALQSTSNYERTKYLAEKEVLNGVERGLRGVLMCPGAIIGRYDTRNWGRVVLMVSQGNLPGVPGGSAPFCGVDEVVRAHIAAVERGKNGERYIVAGDKTALVEFVRLIGARLGKKVPTHPTPLPLLRAVAWAGQLASYVTRREPGLTPHTVAILARPPSAPRSDKAKRELGYETVPPETLVTRACDWMRSERLL